MNALQERIAALLGFEAALFVPTGTQSNLCGVMAHCQRGDEYIVGQMAHTYRWEGGGAAVFGSVQPQPLTHQPDGRSRWPTSKPRSSRTTPHFARTRLLALENTLGGKVLPLAYLEAATALARRRGLATHLDGARLFNAAVAARRRCAREARASRASSTASRCASRKGLGAPVGSALCGSQRIHRRARTAGARWLGGGMRQAGVLAAAALHALDHHVERLAEDHAHARAAGRGPAGPARREGRAAADQHGLRRRSTRRAAAGLVEHLRARGVLATGLYRLRFVTHLDVDAAASTAPSPHARAPAD